MHQKIKRNFFLLIKIEAVYLYDIANYRQQNFVFCQKNIKSYYLQEDKYKIRGQLSLVLDYRKSGNTTVTYSPRRRA